MSSLVKCTGVFIRIMSIAGNYPYNITIIQLNMYFRFNAHLI